jgi:hypothetical protein
MGCLGLILLLFITLPVVFILLFLNVVTISFGKLGLSPDAAFMLLFAILIGSTINLPISRAASPTGRPVPPTCTSSSTGRRYRPGRLRPLSLTVCP